MSDDAKLRANHVVESFRTHLGDELCEAVGEYGFQALQGMVREALAEQAESIVSRLERDLKELRSEVVERRALEI